MRATTRPEGPEIVVSPGQDAPDAEAASAGHRNGGGPSSVDLTANGHAGQTTTTTSPVHPLIPSQSPERHGGEQWEADRDRRRFAGQRRHSWAAQRPYVLH